ncbi:2-oxo acid dehydrogenase subunit E2 [Natrarchaeobius chitinivorans]|uniref:2-oxo acid dehydrogenase subunit E2 n=2 Tax=Natrarchaeobius chitinivorans TaxID=1679083 RepID=A0A3N6M188_NATCH|nr:2-oxo acid dehydrogenase subunit E2 [Natrarchaeobius chitinivorans]
MGYLIRMPQLGMSMDKGEVLSWEIDEGTSIDEGEVIALVESEKTTREVETREAGSLRKILTPEGTTVSPGTAMGILADPDEDLSTFEDELGQPLSEAVIENGGTTGSEAEVSASGSPDEASSEGGNQSGEKANQHSTDVRATPGARRLAEERSVNLTTVSGTGPGGVVTEDDVDDHLEATEDDAAATRTVREVAETSGMQETVGRRLGESYRNAVHVTLNRSFDTEVLQNVREAAKSRGVDISLTDLLIKSVGKCLKSHPEFNAVYEDGEHKLIDEVNVGVAVDVEDGLVTPVVPTVTEKSIEAVSTARSERTERIQSGDFTTDDLTNGTFTISNLGPLGVDNFDPIINPPEIAILGVGRIRADGTMSLSLSFDHRVVNGADAARFLDSLVDMMTDTACLLEFFSEGVTVQPGPAEIPETNEINADLSDREIQVENQREFAGRYHTVYGSTTFDEPESVGGTGTAPSPVDHLLGALGSCVSLTLRQVAENDGIEMGGIACNVTGQPENGPLEAVDIDLRLETDVDDTTIEKAVTKSERACYVKRSLSDDVSFSLEWGRMS